MSTSTPLRSSTSPPTSCCSGSDPLKQTLLKRPQFNPNLMLCHLVQLWSLENSLISLTKQAWAVRATPSCCLGVLCTAFWEHMSQGLCVAHQAWCEGGQPPKSVHLATSASKEILSKLLFPLYSGWGGLHQGTCSEALCVEKVRSALQTLSYIISLSKHR